MRNQHPCVTNILINILLLTAVYYPHTSYAQRKKHTDKDSLQISNIDYFKENYLRTEDFIYKPNIKTVLFYRDGFTLTAPVINVNSGERLVLSFDDLDGVYKRMSYTLIHCDSYWNVSDVQPIEYLNDYFEDDITEYQYSFNTLQKYIHYRLVLPGEHMQPILSGNYLLKVYVEDEPDNIILTRRLMIVDPKVNIIANVRQPVVVEYRKYKQEVDFGIDLNGYTVNDPYKNLKVIVQQNGRWDNAILNLKPLYINGDNLNYNYEDQNVFWGGNIFREFDIKALNFYTEFISKIIKDTNGYNVYLLPEERKTFKVFVSRKDIHGRMYIKSDDNIDNSDIEAEYVHVYFFLKYDAPMVDGGIFVCGALTDWRFSEDAKMKYNYNLKAYEANLFVKQGFYNYQYIFLENGSAVGDETIIEGSHYETDNEYTIFVYHREQGKIYDVLVGFKQFNTYSK